MASPHPDALQIHGWAKVDPALPVDKLAALREAAFRNHGAGTRCLLDVPEVRDISMRLKQWLVRSAILPEASVAIQAIAFDKTAATNWKVPWHQDLMFPLARPATAEGFDLPTVKDGVPYARPPVAVLEDLLAVRLHLDDCDESNGPLRVSPGTHTAGIVPSRKAAAYAAAHGETACLAKTGEAILMRPLLLHASSQASKPGRRRVLHFVYHSGGPMTEEWHRRL